MNQIARIVWKVFYRMLRQGATDLKNTQHVSLVRLFITQDNTSEREKAWSDQALDELARVFAEKLRQRWYVDQHVPVVADYDGDGYYWVLDSSFWNKVLCTIDYDAQFFIDKHNLNQNILHRLTEKAIPIIEKELINEGLRQLADQREEEEFRAQHAPGRI